MLARRVLRSTLGFATLALFLIAAIGATAAAGETEAERGAAYTLARKYAPITMLREQRDPPCDKAEEQYEPTNVNTVLGNPDVTLQRFTPEDGLIDVTRAPTATDIAGLSDTYYLNLRGEALGDTCVYARDFRKLAEEHRAAPTTYAHIARESGHSGFALQYWFFWYFNQFNDLHEGDWEGMQITFEAETPEQALAEEPEKIILFQHAGGERANWSDGKVQKDGTHPVVYPAAGSHATFYDSAVYVENGQAGSGLGCDNTSEPVREVRPNPVLLPERSSTTGEFRWLSYEGRWGEKEKGYNNGPQGPITKTVWSEPFNWMEAQRSTSPRLPGGSIAGPQVTKAFCGAVAAASAVINLDNESRPAAIATIVIPIAVIVLLIFLTKWGPVDLRQLRAKRRFGQLVRTAEVIYRRHFPPLVAIGLTAIPIVGGANLLAAMLSTGQSVDEAAGSSGFNLAGADLVEGLGRPVAMAIVAGAVVVFVRLMVESREPGFRSAWGGLRKRFWRVVGAQLMATLGVILLAITIIGLPWAIYKYVAWSFVKQEVLFTDKSIREAFRGSSDLVRGRWFHTVRVAGFLFLVSIVVGPICSFALIFTALPLIWINFVGSLIFALLIPYVAVGETLLYFDLQARAAVEPAKGARSWKLWRPRQFGRVVRRPVFGDPGTVVPSG